MKVYPYNYPLILTDEIFEQLGGQTDNTVPVQRAIAYQLAEQQATSHIGTFLLPTIVTGVYDYQYGDTYVATDYGYVHKIMWARVLNAFGQELFVITGTQTYAAIREDTYGYLWVRDALVRYGCPINQPYQFQFVYEAGLPTGTANQPGPLLGLTIAAQISLSEMNFPFSNEGAGDVGITEFSSLGYSEKRKLWKNTAFGSSPRAAKAAQLFDSTIKKARRAVMLGRM